MQLSIVSKNEIPNSPLLLIILEKYSYAAGGEVKFELE
jgi:hypothetical protein